MNTILLIRQSEFQVYCANVLWKGKHISAVIVEEGYAFERESGVIGTLDLLWRNARTLLNVIAKNPLVLADYVKLYLYKDKYLGRQSIHNKRLLHGDYSKFAEDLPVIKVDNINSDQVSAEIRAMKPDVVLVFGTRLIKSQLFAGQLATFVNMHWGWSPDYRAEGIVSALAVEGPSALGVTVHLLSEHADGGNILYQARPAVDDEDNFYSIGLKLTLIGVGLFTKVLEEFQRNRTLSGQPQDLSHGRVYSARYMKTNPMLYHEAWKNLKNS
jgi:methionyl-tRNA formyltransferase